MQLKELYDGVSIKSRLKVLNGRTGRVMACNYRPETHGHLDTKEILAVWADLEITDSGFGDYCRPIMKCYISEEDDNG